jgi:hypothetical protein
MVPMHCQLLDEADVIRRDQTRRADHYPLAVGDNPNVPGFESRTLHDLGSEILEALALAIGPFEKRILDHLPDRSMVLLGGGSYRVTRRQIAFFDHSVIGHGEHPTSPSNPIPKPLEESVAVRALGDRRPHHGRAASACPILQPARQKSANASSPVCGLDCGITPVRAGQLRISHQAIPIEDPDRALGQVMAGPLPVTDDVSLVDDDFPDVDGLLSRDQLENRVGVLPCEGTSHEVGRKIHERY